MLRFQSDDFPQMEKRYRTRLINSLSGFKGANLIGSADGSGQTNLAVFSSVVHIGANPALLGFIMRPVSVTRNTYDNIRTQGHYTINHITADFYQQAHQTSARYPADVSEFAEVGLTPEFKGDFPAPFVGESPVQIGLQFREELEITINKTLLIIGEVKEIYLPEDCLQEDGYLDIEKAGTIAISGLDGYHSTRKMGRLSYAKPDQPLRRIDG